jgi:hypothetical protein
MQPPALDAIMVAVARDQLGAQPKQNLAALSIPARAERLMNVTSGIGAEFPAQTTGIPYRQAKRTFTDAIHDACQSEQRF